jgi:hypothetical protein
MSSSKVHTSNSLGHSLANKFLPEILMSRKFNNLLNVRSRLQILPEHPAAGGHHIDSQAKIGDSVGQDNSPEFFLTNQH